MALDPTTNRHPSRMRVRAGSVAYWLGACVMGLVPIWVLGANENTGFVALFALTPLAIGAPFVTLAYALSANEDIEIAHDIVLYLLVAGNVTLLASRTWNVVLFGGCWNCEFPFWVAKILLVATPLALAGSRLRSLNRRIQNKNGDGVQTH